MPIAIMQLNILVPIHGQQTLTFCEVVISSVFCLPLIKFPSITPGEGDAAVIAKAMASAANLTGFDADNHLLLVSSVPQQLTGYVPK